MEVMSRDQLISEIESLSDTLSEFGLHVLKRTETSSQEALSWLDWCHNKRNVKVTPWDVPGGILPPGCAVTIHDVKVGGDKGQHGPDDKIYNNNPDIRDKVARGNTVLEMHDTLAKCVTHDMAIFALRKFTGGMGDEDEDQPENDLVWQRYFLKPLDQVTRVVAMIKENGEAGHVSVRVIGDKFFFIAGSKNVHLVFRTDQDLELYTDSRFKIAKVVGSAWLRQLDSVPSSLAPTLLSFLAESRLTMIFEILCPDYQHVVDLSYLDQPQLKFLTLTHQYRETGEAAHTSLAAFSPDVCIEFARHFGLDTAEYEVMEAGEAEDRMDRVREGQDYEGEVLYFMDKDNNTVGLLKKKTTWYIVLRAIREKVSHVWSTYRKNPGGWNASLNSSHLAKLDKRLDEIQRWLSLSDEDTRAWKMRGRAFQTWLVAKLLSRPGDLDKFSVRGNFPQLWKLFNVETSLQRSDSSVMEVDTGAGMETGNILEEPRGSSPLIDICDDPDSAGVHVGAFILRNVDLLGKNLKRLVNAVQKTHKKVCDNKKLAVITCLDLKSIHPVKSRSLIFKNTKPKPHLLDGEDKILCSPDDVNEATEVSESTEDIMIVIISNKSEEVLTSVFNALIQQIYHLAIRLNCVEKCVHVEKVKISYGDNLVKYFPESLPNI